MDPTQYAGPPGDESEGGESADEKEPGLSLEELSQSYGRVLEQQSPRAADTGEGSSNNGSAVAGPTLHAPEGDDAEWIDDDTSQDAIDACPITPLSILEAVLFVGHPDGRPVTAGEVAGLMRGVSEAEVDQLVADLNALYSETHRAVRAVASGGGYRLQIADDLAFMKERFYGRVREVRLNQAAIDCLALVSYQPGISREKLDQQRGQSSGSVLNQLVRRELLEIRRESVDGKSVACYHPTDRLLELAGLASLDDLPQSEELDGSG